MAFQKAIVITTLGKRPNSIQMAEIDDSSLFGDGGPRKRKRLTHLTADEKMMRRYASALIVTYMYVYVVRLVVKFVNQDL